MLGAGDVMSVFQMERTGLQELPLRNYLSTVVTLGDQIGTSS